MGFSGSRAENLVVTCGWRLGVTLRFLRLGTYPPDTHPQGGLSFRYCWEACCRRTRCPSPLWPPGAGRASEDVPDGDGSRGGGRLLPRTWWGVAQEWPGSGRQDGQRVPQARGCCTLIYAGAPAGPAHEWCGRCNGPGGQLPLLPENQGSRRALPVPVRPAAGRAGKTQRASGRLALTLLATLAHRVFVAWQANSNSSNIRFWKFLNVYLKLFSRKH